MERSREHECPLGRRVVDVGEIVGTGRHANLRANHEHGSGRPAELDSVDHDQRVRRREQLLDEVDAADARVEDVDVRGHAFARQALSHDNAEAVVAAQDVPDAGDEHAHVEQDTGVDAVVELERRLEQYPEERYPVQHATACFHLGVELVAGGRLADAEASLETAVRLFERNGLEPERAKALNALGGALRLGGRVQEAAEAFAGAAATFAARGLAVEEGAARFNLGLSLRELGDLDAARTAFEAAATLGERTLAGSAAERELGATLLQAGDAPGAAAVLERAVATLRDRGDAASLGAAANVLGLARLARGDAAGALAAFADALAAHPRSVRPAEYAMVKANLALAHEQLGDPRRARLAARQALGTPSRPAAVAAQAEAALARLGPGDGDLAAVLEAEPKERWPALLREELVRWADTELEHARVDAQALVETQAARPEPEARDLAEAWLAALLELPPEAMERVVAAFRAAGLPERFRADVESALARFHAPQILRVKDAFGWSSPPT